jgi:hypothetical protein
VTDTAIHPELEREGSFEHLKLGKLPVRHDERTLLLATYLDDAAVLPNVPPELSAPTVDAWPMYGNDRLGDCTIAAVGHMIQAWTSDAGAPRQIADADVEQAYIPGTGTDDTGRFELDVLNYWRTTGVGADKIAAYAAIDPSNHAHVMAAAYLFGGVYIGVALPTTAQGQPVWDVVGDGKTGPSQPGSWGGHAVDVVAYDSDGLTIVTWGALLKMTWGFWDAYVEEAYAVISPDFLNAAGQTPAGFDAAALQADLAAVTAAGNAPAGAEEHAPEDAAPTEQAALEQEPAEAPPPTAAGIMGDGFFWNG